MDANVSFRTPFYHARTLSDEVIFEDDVDTEAQNESSEDSRLPYRRRLPSMAVGDMRRKSSEKYKSQRSDSSYSVVSKRFTDQTGADIAMVQLPRDGSTLPRQNNNFQDSVETPDVLTNFAPIAVEYFAKEKERKERLKKYPPPKIDVQKQLQLLKLRYSASQASAYSISSLLARKRVAIDMIDLKSLARLHFPPRAEVKVYVTDFKEQGVVEIECRLSQITKYLDSKPEDVQIRWIHVPLGLGPLHSTIEELFLTRGPKGRPFNKTGRSGFPYVKLEVLNFCNSARFQQMRDVYHFLHDDQELTKELEKECWNGFEPSSKTKGRGVLDDLKWRTSWLGLADDWETLPDFWTTSNSDVPCQLTEGLMMSNYGPLDGLRPTLWHSDQQVLHKHKFFGSAQLVRDIFRFFHRSDGKSPPTAPGINRLTYYFVLAIEQGRGACKCPLMVCHWLIDY